VVVTNKEATIEDLLSIHCQSQCHSLLLSWHFHYGFRYYDSDFDFGKNMLSPPQTHSQNCGLIRCEY
jgi:hypothetical protein